METPSGGVLRIPRALIDDACLELDLSPENVARMNAAAKAARMVPQQDPLRFDTDPNRDVAAAWLQLPDSVRRDLVEACIEDLTAADGEGLGAPYDEEAYSLAEYVASKTIEQPGKWDAPAPAAAEGLKRIARALDFTAAHATVGPEVADAYLWIREQFVLWGDSSTEEPAGLMAGSRASTCQCYEGSVGCLGPPCVTEPLGDAE